jgi:hypothetical protein
MTPRTLSDPTIGEGVLEPTKPVEETSTEYVTLIHIWWVGPDGQTYQVDDDCPF